MPNLALAAGAGQCRSRRTSSGGAWRSGYFVAIVMAISFEEPNMRFASVAEVKNNLSAYLNRARSRNEPIVVTHHGKPYALIQPLSEKDLEALSWGRLAEQRLREAWDGEDDALYDYL